MKHLFRAVLAVAWVIGPTPASRAQTVKLSPHAAVTITKLEAKKKNEQSTDEMYFKKNEIDIRPLADDDSYWEFDNVGDSRQVGQPLFEGRAGVVRLQLWEQDPDIVDPDDHLGSITLRFKDGKYDGFMNKDGTSDPMEVLIATGKIRTFVVTFEKGNEGRYEVTIEVQEAVQAVNACVHLYWQDGPIGQSTSDEPMLPHPAPADNTDEIKIARHRMVEDPGQKPIVNPLATLPGYDTYYKVKKAAKPIWIVHDGGQYPHVALGGGLLTPGRKITIAVGMTEKDGHLDPVEKIDPKTGKKYTVWVHNADDAIADFHIEIELEKVPGSAVEFHLRHTWVAAANVKFREQSTVPFSDATLNKLGLKERAQIQATGSGVDYRLIGVVVESPDDCSPLKH